MNATGREYWVSAARSTRAAWGDALDLRGLPSNVMAGVSTALVAIPLNVALALACGLPAGVGLWTGAVAGVVGAVLGGAKLQVTGPEVALAPLTFAIVSEHGPGGLLWCTVIAGLLQIVLAVAHVGRFVRAVPAPVVLGFMVAVGVMVIDAQLPRLMGLPSDVRSIAGAGLEGLGAMSLAATGVGVLVASLAMLLPKLGKRVPAPLLALVAAVAVTMLFGLEVPRVPGLDGLVPELGAPPIGLQEIVALLPSAIALAMLASLDSLLSAASVDARLGTRHRSDQELAAQGVANLVSGLVGGMPVAGAIVRSVAAIEAGGTNRLAPLAQSVVLGAVLLALGGLLDLLPIAALAAILIVVGLKLLQPRAVLELWRRSKLDVAIAGVTVVAILGVDFVAGVAAGIGAALLRMAVTHARPRVVTSEVSSRHGALCVVRIDGPLHFASHHAVDRALSSAGGRAVVLDLSQVSAIDVTAANSLRQLLAEHAQRGAGAWVVGACAEVARELARAGVDAVSAVPETARTTRRHDVSASVAPVELGGAHSAAATGLRLEET